MIANETASFDDHLRAIQREGALVVLYGRAKSALRDQRLERSHRLVYAELLECMNSEHGFCYPSRQMLSERTGLSLRAVENALYELRSWGYVDWERRYNDAGTRKLLHYTVPAARIDYDTLQDEIRKLRQSVERRTTPPAVQRRTTPPVVQSTPPAVQETTPPTVQKEPKYTARGGRNCTAGGVTVTNEEELENIASEVLSVSRSTTLDPDFELQTIRPTRAKPRSRFPDAATALGSAGLIYALDEGLTEHEAHGEFDAFRNHHIGKGTLMADWSAAWRTWVGNAKRWGRVGKAQHPQRSARPSVMTDLF